MHKCTQGVDEMDCPQKEGDTVAGEVRQWRFKEQTVHSRLLNVQSVECEGGEGGFQENSEGHTLFVRLWFVVRNQSLKEGIQSKLLNFWVL